MNITTIVIWVILVIAVINSLMIFSVYDFIQKVSTPANNTVIPTDNAPIANVGIGVNPVRGPANAKITMVAFSDYQCPYCQRAEATITQILQENDIKVYFRNWPLPAQMHPDALNAAEAAQCANEQNKFWEMHDKLFASQANLTVAALKQYAVDLGLNATQFNTCLDTNKYSALITKDQSDGTGYGVQGTPTFFIGTSQKGYQMVVGSQPIDVFNTVLNSYK